MAADLKKALRERRTIIFVGQSKLSERPHRMQPGASRTRTPVLWYRCNWNVLSAAAAIICGLCCGPGCPRIASG